MPASGLHVNTLGINGKRIVVGVTGGIAAYKAVEVCRRLVDAGAHVIPVMTAAAEHFIGRTTLSALCSEPVQTSLWDFDRNASDGASAIPHTRLGQSADAIVVVPATARLLAAYTIGLSTDLLSNILIATRAPVIVCPAMHTEMWEHPAVQDNLAVLRRRGVIVVEPDVGRLAGGDSGQGRLATPERIVAAIDQVFAKQDLAGTRIVVTAGGTREPIDAVRVIANRSSGKQGYAIAAEALARGATVTLISTVELATPVGAELVKVETAAQMQAAVESVASGADIIVMAAAVADFRVADPTDSKIKKEHGIPQILLEPTPDILAGLGQRKHSGQVLVGFAAETNDLVANADAKLRRKNLDLIVANDVSASGVGFQHDTNAVSLLRPDSQMVTVTLTDKRSIARAVLDCVVEIRNGYVVS